MNEFSFPPRDPGSRRQAARGRRELIAGILSSRVIASQEALLERLDEHGVVVSQATLSRDLKALGVQRVRTTDGVFAYALPAEPPSATSPRSFVARFATSTTAVRRSGFVVLVFTLPGEAQLVGRLLDQTALDGLLGTVAGDDTVMCIAVDEPAAARIEAELTAVIA